MKIAIKSERTMQEFGEKLSRVLRGGTILELIGDVGAGKTTLTRSIARGLGITDPIQSPTFTISNRYRVPSGLQLAHYDFYRLQDAGIMKDELIEVLDDDQIITVIEWGDIIEDVLPDDHLTIHFESIGEQERLLEIIGHGAVTRELVEQLV